MSKPILLASLLGVAACASSPTPAAESAPDATPPAIEHATPAEAEPAAPPPATCPEQAGICFEVEPDDAELKVNDDDLGIVRDIAAGGIVFVSLEPGIHLVTLKREGYATWRAEVTVGPVAETMKVTLEASE